MRALYISAATLVPMADISGSKVLVLGGSGVLGGLIATEIAQRGGKVALAGRSRARLRTRAEAIGSDTHVFVGDLVSPDVPERIVGEAHDVLGGLDGLICAAGEVAFGPFRDLDDSVLERLTASNLTGPLRTIRSALGRIGSGGFVVGLTGAVVDTPTAGMAAYSSVKSGLSAALSAVAREARRDGVYVLDARPPHTETGLAERAIAGSAPELPTGLDPAIVARTIVDAVESGTRTLPPDAFKQE